MTDLLVKKEDAGKGSAQTLVERLQAAMPVLVYTEEKFHFPARTLDHDELVAFFRQIKTFFGEAEDGVSANTVRRVGVNIPLRLLDNIDEERAASFIELLRPTAEKIYEREKFIKILSAISGTFVERQWNPQGYEIDYIYEGKTDPLRSMGEALNAVLGEELFEWYTRPGTPAFCLFISDDDIRKFVVHSNLQACIDIFHNPRQKCTEYRRGSVGGRLVDLADRVFHPLQRPEPDNLNRHKNWIGLGAIFTPRALPERSGGSLPVARPVAELQGDDIGLERS
jgi:hypothetical protein